MSTDEQAEEGFSIDGQANRLRSYAELHELGPVTVVEDPGWSGKDLIRPGLQQLLGMVEAGHVAHVLIWRLDRLSRNLRDLILLADKLGQAEVALHSFTEKLDLSSATGRMFYNVLGSFCQRTSGSPHWRTLEFPADGHEFSPRTDTEFPTDRPGSFTRPAASPPSRWWRLEA